MEEIQKEQVQVRSDRRNKFTTYTTRTNQTTRADILRESKF